MTTMREQWQRQLDDLRRKLVWTETFLRDALRKNLPEQAERSRQRLAALKREIHDHRAKLSFVQRSMG